MCFAMEFIIITVEKQVGAQLLIIITNTMGSFAPSDRPALFQSSSIAGAQSLISLNEEQTFWYLF